MGQSSEINYDRHNYRQAKAEFLKQKEMDEEQKKLIRNQQHSRNTSNKGLKEGTAQNRSMMVCPIRAAKASARKATGSRSKSQTRRKKSRKANSKSKSQIDLKQKMKKSINV